MFMSRCNPVIKTEVNIETNKFHSNMHNIFKGTNVKSFGYNVNKNEYWINAQNISFSLHLENGFNNNTIIHVDNYIGSNQKEIYKILNLIISKL